jgi:cyclopropane-fatty-acyl-phospholipid synthase
MAAADDQRTVTHPKAARRLEGFKRLLAHLRATLPIDVGVILWDGSTVPGDLAPDALALVIADEGVVAALLKRPSIDTFLNLWVTARIDIRGGWPSDIVARRPKLHVREVLKRLDKRLAFGALTPFLTVPRGGPWPLEDIHGHKARADGSEAANKANVAYHYDLSNAFYALFLDPEMIYTCAYFRDWDNDLATAQRDKLDMICRKLRLKPGDRFLDIGCGWAAWSVTRRGAMGCRRTVSPWPRSSSPTPRRRSTGWGCGTG